MSRDPHRALMAALADYLGPLDDVVTKTRDWASATFVGMQHEIAFVCTVDAVLIDALPDVDLPMAGQFVADLEVVSCDARGPYHYVEIEVLTVCE
jgi:hypothetical protein